MDSHNLAVVFAPTLFRSDMTDPMKALMEIRLSQIILKEIIERKSILYNVLKLLRNNTQNEIKNSMNNKIMIENPIMSFRSLEVYLLMHCFYYHYFY
jgi:hypothetical protein